MSRIALALAAALLASPAAAEDAVKDLLPHRAIYELSLADSPASNAITAASGRLVIEFLGDTCEGFTMQMRLVTRVSDGDGKSRTTDLRSSTFETGDGAAFDFLSQTFIDQRLANEAKGAARRQDAKLAIGLERPQKKELSADGPVVFPTEQTARILEAARAGRRTLELIVYEGSENGEKIFQTTTVIGSEQQGPENLGNEPAASVFGTLKRWPVTISYFDREKKAGEDTPDTQLSFILYDNGVTRKLRLDYGDFALLGRLTEVSPFERKPCP